MTHLGPAETIDAVDGHAGPEAVRHLEACARCREAVQAAAGVLDSVKRVPTPEVSPLYWNHLASNIRERLRERPRARRTLAWMWTPATAIVGAVALAIGLSNTRSTGPAPHSAATRSSPVDRSAPVLADDSSWTVMSEITDDLGWDEVEAAGLSMRPGAADRALADLSNDQREELARLLHEEMARLKS